jgi:hypothetical protein
VTVQPPRDGATRKQHVLHLLETEIDAWVATADESGEVCQIPLSFLWYEGRLVFSTPEGSVTGRNLARSGRVRVALGATRDVVLIQGEVESVAGTGLAAEVGDAFAARHRWDPRQDSAGKAGAYAFYFVTPVVIQSWREANELKGRTLMREGAWLV